MPLSVLLVEDDPDDARLFERMLGRDFPDHYMISTASDVASALDVLSSPEADDLDAIVLDLGLPDSVGLDGLDRLSDATTKRVPVVILSGVEDASLAQKAIKGNAQDYINKQQMTAAAIDRAVCYAIERQRAQVELNASRERFRHFADIATDRFWELDKDLRFIDASGTLQDQHQPTKSDLLGRTFWDVDGFAPTSVESWDPLIDAMVQRRDVDAFEMAYTNTDGEQTFWLINASPIYAGTTFLGYRGTAQDISLQKGIEAELRELNGRKDKFFSIIAHDLRSPFASLMGAAGFFRDGIYDANQEEAQELGTMMYDTAQRAYNLVDDLLQWSRLQLQQDALRPKKIQIEPIVSEVFDLTSPVANGKKIELKSNVQDDTDAYIDPQAMSTILRNLVGNAVKFTEPNGVVTVSTDINNDRIVIVVSDTGVGMPTDKINDLQSIDEVVSTKGTAGEQGTGLGLVLCHELATKSNGAMLIESTVGEGTKVSVTLPRDADEQLKPDNNNINTDGESHEEAHVS